MLMRTKLAVIFTALTLALTGCTLPPLDVCGHSIGGVC